MVEATISYGDLVDKFVISMIKKNKLKINDVQYVDHIASTHEMFNNMDVETKQEKIRYAQEQFGIAFNTLNGLYDDFYKVHLLLWQIEDDLREHETNQTFEQDFIDSARLRYKTNDKRKKYKEVIEHLFTTPKTRLDH